MDTLSLPAGVVTTSDLTGTYDILARTPFHMGFLVATDQDLPVEDLDPTAVWTVIDTEDDRVVLDRSIVLRDGTVERLGELFIITELAEALV
ncbi:MAG: hypothetical protein JWR63_2003 [Conexibacter sp.]|nr:hypothetical protein [Conexibacter sp.]